MLRVLTPAGLLILADIEHQAEYLAPLRAANIVDLRVDDGGVESAVIGRLSGNSFRPYALMARKRASVD